MRDLGPNERFAYREINAAEGGGVPDYSDPEAAGPAVAGITAGTLSSLDVPGVPPGTMPEDLQPWQWPQAYRSYFDSNLGKAGGGGTFENIGHPGVAAFAADTSFRGGPAGIRMIQQAVNKVRKDQGLPTIGEDDIFGPETLGAVNQVIAAPEDQRAFAEALKKFRDRQYSDETWRTDHFLKLASPDAY